MEDIPKPATFAPAFENESGERIDILNERRSGRRHAFPFFFSPFARESETKKKMKKKLPKKFGRYVIKFLPLHPLSERNAIH